ncbi:hypothetical protein F5Y14DRAFT_419527 [Nemania sp. NC0429]|nr:hypothetical protein F5Y14DRAFT_419527 [Nemania sp. NC0429]
MNQHRHKQRTSSAAPYSKVPDINTGSYEQADSIKYSYPRFSYGMRLDPLSPVADEDEEVGAIDGSDWLMEVAVDLSQDLDTSKKELDVIKFILKEMELRPCVDRRPEPNSTREAQVQLMRACREHSGVRCHMLRERLRQVQSWAHSRKMGQQVPGKAPDEVSSIIAYMVGAVRQHDERCRKIGP